MTDADQVTLEIIGEGVTDVGPRNASADRMSEGVVVILVHRLCGSPGQMRVKRNHFPYLHGKKLWQKVKFAKRQAFYNKGVQGAVFVMDSEGIPAVLGELVRGRDNEFPDFPMAVGIAHPCIEAWLLCDPEAIRRAGKLKERPLLPEHPEQIPAPQHHRGLNPKTELARISGAESASEKSAIAHQIRDLAALRAGCPLGFGVFSVEVERFLMPLFTT
ncbi:MAG: hypothetical protein ACKV0T_17540 [Planctomycetales bacterium]